MSNDDLKQTEADALLAMEKIAATTDAYDFPRPGDKASVPLESRDGREAFLLDWHRGRIAMSKIKYQHRARQTVVLARLELNGAPHRNPDGQEVPCPHLHLYREGYGTKWAFPLPFDRFQNPRDQWRTLHDFMGYCRIVEPPSIERNLLT